MLKIEKLTRAVGKHVYTSDGDYFGQVEEMNLLDNKIESWKIRVGSSFMNLLGGAKGVVIPHQFVKSIGDILIINRASLPRRDEGMDMHEDADRSQSMQSI